MDPLLQFALFFVVMGAVMGGLVVAAMTGQSFAMSGPMGWNVQIGDDDEDDDYPFDKPEPGVVEPTAPVSEVVTGDVSLLSLITEMNRQKDDALRQVSGCMDDKSVLEAELAAAIQEIADLRDEDRRNKKTIDKLLEGTM